MTTKSTKKATKSSKKAVLAVKSKVKAGRESIIVCKSNPTSLVCC